MDYWYVLRSKPRQENRAIESFKEQGLVAYCPMLNRVESLFPRYFFLQDTIKAHSAWFRVRSTWGGTGFVQFGQWFARVSDEMVDGIRHQERALFDRSCLDNDGFAEGLSKDMQAVYQCAV